MQSPKKLLKDVIQDNFTSTENLVDAISMLCCIGKKHKKEVIMTLDCLLRDHNEDVVVASLESLRVIWAKKPKQKMPSFIRASLVDIATKATNFQLCSREFAAECLADFQFKEFKSAFS